MGTGIRAIESLLVWLLLLSHATAQVTLLGHWPMQKDVEDVSGNRHLSHMTDVRFVEGGPNTRLSKCADFNGRSSKIQVESFGSASFGAGPFSIATWIRVPNPLDDVPGDLLSLFDSRNRQGINLAIGSHGGVTNSQPNHRQLHFGVDWGAPVSEFTDHGRLGNAVFIFAMCVHQGRLYASTCHAGEKEAGRVYRYESDSRWTDLGSPGSANAISAMISWQGSLYVASSKYRLAGSSLTESGNPNFGGQVFRLSESDQWISCGQLSPQTEAVSSLVEFQGNLYAASLYKPAGFFRYLGGEQWLPCEVPDGKRIEATTVFNGFLYGTCYDEGSVFRYDGKQWERVGVIPGATQTYGLAVYRGRLFVSEWPQAHVYRWDGGAEWEDVGKLGNELEAMPLLVYNGKMYGGTLPSAEIYRYDEGRDWTRIGQVDMTPDVKYRRAWSMAVYTGRLFVGTLPSGHVLSFETGANATYDKRFPDGWHHIAAVRDANRLTVYLDGRPVTESQVFDQERADLSSRATLEIGAGAIDHFHGQMADLRLYKGVLSEADVKALVADRF